MNEFVVVARSEVCRCGCALSDVIGVEGVFSAKGVAGAASVARVRVKFLVTVLSAPRRHLDAVRTRLAPDLAAIEVVEDV